MNLEILYPTLDLHCHLRGTIEPEFAMMLAKKNGVEFPQQQDSFCYSYASFEEFLELYDRVGRVVKTPDDIRDIAFRYLKSVSAEGTSYVEFMVSPMHSIENGISYHSQISAISEAIERSAYELGVNCSIIITCVRHRGPDEAMLVASLARDYDFKYVKGFGLVGNEKCFAVDKFERAFKMAEDCGLSLTAHAGEWLDARSVLDAVNILGLSRVGHGISIVENQDIMLELSERKIGFEVCLSSNVYLGICDNYGVHPVRQMLDAGCNVTFSTDDPAYFQTTPSKEMHHAIESLLLTQKEQYDCFRSGINMAFCDEITKKNILGAFSM